MSERKSRPVATEYVTLTETKDKQAVVILNEDMLAFFFDTLANPLTFTMSLRSLLIMARWQLSQDLKTVKEDDLITISHDAQHKDCLMELRMCMSDDGVFVLLTYWGGAASRSTKLSEAILHAMEVLSLAENNYT